MAELAVLAGSFSIIAPLTLPERTLEVDVCLESLRGVRPDLDSYDVDLDPSDAALEFRRGMLRAAGGSCLIVGYRPSSLVSSLAFTVPGVTVAGQFHQRQAAFEYKPWVERELGARGITGLPWSYVAYEQRERAKVAVAHGPHVLRASQTSGGAGIVVARCGEDVDRYWPGHDRGFVAVAPFQAGIPINFSGCVFGDGSIRLHPPSVQLIGIESCTDRSLGYCGNDFGAATELLERTMLKRIDRMGRAVGAWLHEERYLGAFGIDAIVAGDELYFTELNPRFQGSSTLSAAVARQLEVPDLFLDHLVATLGLAPTAPAVPIWEWARLQAPLSQFVIHNTSNRVVAPGVGAPVVPHDVCLSLRAEIPVDPGGTLCRVTVERSITTTGFALDADMQRVAGSLTAGYSVAKERRGARAQGSPYA